MPRKQAPKAQPYTLELTYMVPYCGTFTVTATDPEDACAKAFALLEQDPSAYDAFDTSAEWETGPTFVESIVEGEVPWGCAGVGAAVSVPAGWGNPEEALRVAAAAVVAAWEGGDLAGAVRALARVLDPAAHNGGGA